jgi:hypothetical protein
MTEKEEVERLVVKEMQRRKEERKKEEGGRKKEETDGATADGLGRQNDNLTEFEATDGAKNSPDECSQSDPARAGPNNPSP